MPDNPAGKNLVDLAVTWHRLRSPGLRVVVYVVPAAVPKENAAELLQSPDEVESLQATSNSSTFLIPGI